MSASPAVAIRDSFSTRVFNVGTLLGLISVPLAAFLLILVAQGGSLDDTWPFFLYYFAATYIVFFPLLRLLPYRGRRAVLFALPLVVLSVFGMWWGGLGVGAALIMALALPNRLNA